ncbi:MAG: HelD family protein [Christensenellales bacterium]|jgi:DNA helicase-2/ATP-dependent DNA helicase PcrA
MSAAQHPAYAEERRHLDETIDIIALERDVAVNDRLQAEGSLSTARMYDPDALPLREMMYLRAVQTERNLASAMAKPYFTRIDFTETGGAPKTHYIGKYGVLRTDSLEVAVVDWRAPVANLYYSGQIGPLKYEAPDGVVEGELTLKRQFTIENGEIRAIFDADIVTQDAFLQGVLGERAGEKLREVVTTIQAEQNSVIRHPMETNLVVQGVAGSGKTTIALHRIAYLLYAHQERLRAENMLILAPNPLFLNYIAQVLPDLGVENVRQTTFERLIADWLGDALPVVSGDMPLEDVLDMPEDARAQYAQALQYKGSRAMLDALDRWLDDFEDSFPPTEDIRFGPVTIYTAGELRQFLLVDEKPFPIKRRLDELKKQLKLRAAGAAQSIGDWYARECDRRINELPLVEPDRAARTARAQKLHDSMLARQKQLKAQRYAFPNAALKQFAPLDPARMYRQFLSDQIAHSADADMRRAAEYTLSKKALEREDIAPIAIIAMRALELKRLDIRHIVIDEAQDFSPLEIELLARAARGATFTIVGDLMQGIRGYRALSDWETLTQGVFAGACERLELTTSYRNTIEIMNFASRVSRNMPVKNLSPATPVLRHGGTPLFQRGGDDALMGIIRDWRDAGMRSIAVVARSRARLHALHEENGWPVLDPQDDGYPSGVVLAPADAVKGLEFDGVILLGADDAVFPARPLDARLLYVCLTRALHKLAVLWEHAPSALLEETTP